MRRQPKHQGTMRELTDCLRLLERNGALALTRSERLDSLVGTLIEGEVRGSWWAHPQGKVVYAVASALEDRADVVVTKLDRRGEDARVTFVHQRLFAQLYRWATDEGVRRERLRATSAAARKAFARVEAEGRIQLGPSERSLRAPAKELERLALVLAHAEHTERGAHETVLRSYEAWASPETKEAAARLDLAAAVRALETAGLVVAPPARGTAGRSPAATSRRSRSR